MARTATRLLRPLLLAIAVATTAGCAAHEHVIGLGPTGLGETSVRQYYLFFGLIRLNEVNAQNLANSLTSYSVRSEFSTVDFLLMPFMLPLTVTSRTVTVKT